MDAEVTGPQDFIDDVSKESEKLIEAIVRQRVTHRIEDDKSTTGPSNPSPIPPQPLDPSQTLAPQELTPIDPPPSDKIVSEASKSMARIKLCLIKRIEDYLANHPDLDLMVLMPMLKAINELQLTEDWTNRLADIIERNPSNLLPPGSGKKGTLTKLQGYAQQAIAKGKDDKRTGRDKLKQGLAYPKD